MSRIGIVGGTGYTGAELLRLLAAHPQVDLHCVTSRSAAGEPVAAMFPQLRGRVDLCFSEPADGALAECDIVFMATPHGAAMAQVPPLLDAGVRVIDLSADFRLRDATLFERWYGLPHACPELLDEAVYGLPERNRTKIASARLVAAPGCYPTAVQLALLPLVEAGLIEFEGLIADCKSGVSGAGREAKTASLYAEVADSFKAYSVSGHRHLPEILQELGAAGGAELELCFVPHLVPMVRGIHATVYARLRAEADLQALYAARYAGEPFVDLMPPGSHPETRSVRASNLCRLAVHRPGGGSRVVVLSVIDNLVKGAAGQAVQCMNRMLGMPETTGLDAIASCP